MGLSTDVEPDSFLADALGHTGAAPERVAIVDGALRLTRGELLQAARRVGSSLVHRGLRRGSAVAFQLPNWHEACVVHLAAAMFGFRLVPLLPMYREAEVGLILGECDVEALFLPDRFRGVSYPELLARVQPRPTSLQHVFVVRGSVSGLSTYDALLADARELLQPAPGDAADVRTILYTSGSTGRPKGVLHTNGTIGALIRFAAQFWGLTPSDVLLVPSPVAHIGGSMYALELPWVAGVTAVLMDRWDPMQAVQLIDREGGTFCAGATPFLEGLLAAAEAAGSRLPSLRRFICGGASVPPALIRRAAQRFAQCTVSRAYGSTEVPVICPGIRSRDDAEFGATTDGECAADVQILDAAGKLVPEGQPGEIVARAPRMFTGYLHAQDNAGAFTADGYFRMGDIGRRVDGRFIEITGRIKDIIIRLGENISPLEIENALAEHVAVQQVAVVGIPDARTGEAALAFVVPKAGAHFDLAEMRRYLLELGLARQKCPEHLRIVPALPTNSIGKVLKSELKAIAARG